MTIRIIPYREEDKFFGSTWLVENEDELADQIAAIAMGYSHHVHKIIRETGNSDLNYPHEVVESAIKLLTVEGDDPSHRDGWLFQAMSWIAAIHENPDAKLAAPHMQHADKGFDGLQIEVDNVTGRIKCAIIFEDKATKNARKTIAGKDKGVWKEFRELEDGKRFNFFTSQVLGVIRTETDLDPDEAIKEVIWKDARRFRVSITVDAKHSHSKGRRRLFSGYDDVVAGDLNRRRAETLYKDDIRGWLASLADRVVRSINDGVDPDV